MAELADALDSKSGDLWSCGFDSHLRYHLNYRLQLNAGAFFVQILPVCANSAAVLFSVQRYNKTPSSRVRAFVDVSNNVQTVYLVAGKVRPSEVGKAISHEIIKRAGGRIEVANADQNMDILILSNDSLDEATSEKAVKESFTDGTSAAVHAAALLNIEKLLKSAKLGVSHRDWHVHAKNQQRN